MKLNHYYYRVPGISTLVHIPAAHREIADLHIALIHPDASFRYGCAAE